MSPSLNLVSLNEAVNHLPFCKLHISNFCNSITRNYSTCNVFIWDVQKQVGTQTFFIEMNGICQAFTNYSFPVVDKVTQPRHPSFHYRNPYPSMVQSFLPNPIRKEWGYPLGIPFTPRLRSPIISSFPYPPIQDLPC